MISRKFPSDEDDVTQCYESHERSWTLRKDLYNREISIGVPRTLNRH